MKGPLRISPDSGLPLRKKAETKSRENAQSFVKHKRLGWILIPEAAYLYCYIEKTRVFINAAIYFLSANWIGIFSFLQGFMKLGSNRRKLACERCYFL